jgi:hypothetical protein
MKDTFTRKGYGRIYVYEEDDIEKVKDIILRMDDFEYEYLPHDFITTIDEYPRVVYTGKFDDLDINALTVLCLMEGVPIFAFDSGHDEYPVDLYKHYTEKWADRVCPYKRGGACIKNDSTCGYYKLDGNVVYCTRSADEPEDIVE